uniref:Axonemal dynein light chain domain containing 1 n=1 Tax=Oryzias latipes TaxID=8090 RepID=A0A3P9KXX1_ORYLA
MTVKMEAQSRKNNPPHVKPPTIPDELLVSLSSTVCNGNKEGCFCVQNRTIRRPDAVWHHPLGRNKYKFFLEQPTSLTGAGSSELNMGPVLFSVFIPIVSGNNLNISDQLIPEEFNFVKNKGIGCLKFYEDAFTVQLMDEEQKLRVFPSLKPSGRKEAVELMRNMDDMLEKAGVDRQNEELSQLSQMEGLLELVKVEQNIYNTVFHELIRQVTVGCAEKGQVLAKLRQCYQALLDRIPRSLKALHTETVAQKSLGRRLTEEIHRIKSSLQQLSMEASKIKDHEALVCEQAEHAHQQLAEALIQTKTDSDVLQRYHELYELLRTRLEAQLLQMTEERNNWSKLTFSLALKLISIKKLHLVGQLHVSERGWFQTTEKDLKEIMELKDHWKDELTHVVSQLKTTERGYLILISLDCIRCSDLKHKENSVEEIHTDLKQWSQILALLSEYYQGEKPVSCQQTLGNLGVVQEKWLNLCLQLFERHPRLYEAPEGQEAVRKLEWVLPELIKQLGLKISGDSGEIHMAQTSWMFDLLLILTPDFTHFLSHWLKLAFLKHFSGMESGLNVHRVNFSLIHSDSEMRVRKAEQRALSAEEALQAALEKIQDLERQLQGQSGTLTLRRQILRTQKTLLFTEK